MRSFWHKSKRLSITRFRVPLESLTNIRIHKPKKARLRALFYTIEIVDKLYINEEGHKSLWENVSDSAMTRWDRAKGGYIELINWK